MQVIPGNLTTSTILGLVVLAACSKAPPPRTYDDLHVAAQVGDEEAVRRMLDSPGENQTPEQLSAALVSAAQATHREVVELLFERGADPSLPDPTGRLPIWAAIYPMSHFEFETDEEADDFVAVAQLFVDHGSPTGMALAYACRLYSSELADRPSERRRQAQVSVVELLCAKADFAGQESGRSALQYVAAAGDVPLAEILLEHGADADEPASEASPLRIALAGGHAEMEALLRSHGATE